MLEYWNGGILGNEGYAILNIFTKKRLMILAAAQLQDQANFVANLEEHLRMGKKAADNGACLLLFPEMSLTGYMRVGAAENSVTVYDVRLDPLRELVAERNIIIIAGAPLLLED